MVPIDSSDMINARFIIGNLPKNAAVMAQPITPHKFYPLGNCKLAKLCLAGRCANRTPQACIVIRLRGKHFLKAGDVRSKRESYQS
jgi:hypothetical protein